MLRHSNNSTLAALGRYAPSPGVKGRLRYNKLLSQRLKSLLYADGRVWAVFFMPKIMCPYILLCYRLPRGTPARPRAGAPLNMNCRYICSVVSVLTSFAPPSVIGCYTVCTFLLNPDEVLPYL